MAVLPNLFGEWTLQREWGRIGQGGHIRLDLFRSATEAKSALKILESAKWRREYEKVISNGSIRISYAHGLTGRIPAAAARTARGVGCLGSTAR
ncbi:hypothetical protein OA238_160p0890 (plasmid) [Octadecabacter arcticus 238]|uniref:WGR domain-containing protein n=2 Tax=Octadecabacter arcticus TaxID=53946 RepID=M9RYG3_9RHOB|nr:hypothetical protein OA238_160p0890 [Octadecabacter arcticus 238]